MPAKRQPGESTGVVKRHTRRTDATARGIEAMQLRLGGLDYQTIADRLGFADKSGAYRAVTRALAEVKRETARESVRLELARLDALLAAVWPLAMMGDLRAMDRVVKIMEWRAKYLGFFGAGAEVLPFDMEAYQDRLNKATKPELVEEMARLTAETARKVEDDIRAYFASAPAEAPAPQWVFTSLNTLRNVSQNAVYAIESAQTRNAREGETPV